MELMCCECGTEQRRPGQRNGLVCHARAMRIYRSKNPQTPEQRRRSNARAYLHVYVKRGKVIKGVCEVCGDPDVEAHHDDYSKPLEVRWRCRAHHVELHGGVAQG